MEDREIVALYWERNEKAITESENKYGRYCYSIALNILRNHEDSEECVNDTYAKAWNSIPPKKPEKLSVFLGKITRNLALDVLDKLSAKKRGRTEITLVLDEISECIPSPNYTEKEIDNRVLAENLSSFLKTLKSENRKIFLQRYWYMMPVKEIAKDNSCTESKVKMSLMRTRENLKIFLEKEGVEI
ncbi:MAG: sigma-70 family RNA polymerase sigma factor [Clostridia bacterium]|nr:sigma-70 family RNA polymerase sigma factor [Clostridia bacterium]